MFKPNIRGVGKHNLHLEAAGWRNRDDNSLIKHRYPLRRSWIERLAGDTSLTPVLSRSGQVFLVQNTPTAENKAANADARAKPRKLILFGLLSVFVVLAGVSLVPIATAKKSSLVGVGPVPAAFDCKGFLQNPEEEITQWLNGTGSEEFAIQEVQREELGGVQLRQIYASCGNQHADFQITLTLRNQAWQLKKFTRLEN